MRDAVLEHKADVGLGFDGDGDRCGVVDNEGDEIFADKVGVMLARDISALQKGATFVVDVKSTGLFMTDPVLIAERRQDRLLEDRPLLHEAPRERDRGGRGLREVRPLLFQQAARPRLRRRADFRARRLRHARPQSRQEHGRSQERAAQDLGLAHHVAALRRRDEIRRGRQRRGAFRGGAEAKGEKVRGQPIRDLVTVNGVRVDGRGRHLGPGARLLQQARTGGRGGKPGLRSSACATCSRPSTPCCGGIRKSAHTTRRSEDRRGGRAQSAASSKVLRNLCAG